MNQFVSALLAVSCLIALPGGQAFANGEIGEHVNELQAHLSEYDKEVRWFIEQSNNIVEAYAKQGGSAVEPAKLVDHWEAVKFHAAIETSYVPVYAAIWQGIFGVHDAIKAGKPAAEVRQEQAALEQAMWQALGAVKMAAKYQADGPAVADAESSGDPVATLAEVKDNLDRVVAKYAERDLETATNLVHDTYAERFEGVEGALIEQDAALVEDLEKDFNVTLPRQLQGSASLQDVQQTVADMKQKLDRAQNLLAEAAKNRRSVF